MLLETKGVTELSLLFGSTWIVNSVVIAAFLIMAIFANAFTMFRPLCCSGGEHGRAFFVFRGSAANGQSAGVRNSRRHPCLLLRTIFSGSFRDVGGILENLVMVGGTPLLGILAVLLYGLSAFFLRAPNLEGAISKEPLPQI